jgi:hypothetical protein
MTIIPPPGFLALYKAREILMQCMHRGIAPAEDIQAYRKDGDDVVDGRRATAAAKILRQAIQRGDLGLFALLSSRDTPLRLHNSGLIKAAQFPPNSTVLTFAYCERHSQAPFGLSWPDLKELSRDPLCLDEKVFRRWLKSQERKNEWPCHQAEGETRNPPGRPSLMDEVIEVIEELSAKGELAPTTPIKTLHTRLQRARPSLRKISESTVRRAWNQTSW